MIVYGRLPLMITENCIIKKQHGRLHCDNFSGLTDRQGALFPSCRNTSAATWSSTRRTFFWRTERSDGKAGPLAERLMFTTENAHECVAVLKRYMGKGDYEPVPLRAGCYFRGVIAMEAPRIVLASASRAGVKF
jgi:putative protease